MKETTGKGAARITPQQIAGAAGVTCRTVEAYASKAGWTENGGPVLFTEKQATIILEILKRAKSNRYGLSLDGGDTAKSRALQIDLLHCQIEAVMQAEIDELKAKVAMFKRLFETLREAVATALPGGLDGEGTEHESF